MTPDPGRVLFEDHHLLVLNKPAPLLTQAPPGVPCLEAWAKQYIKEKYAKPGGVYLGVPHRLDRPVSGVVVFARNTKAAQRLQLQFEGRTVRKNYWALLTGDVQPDAGRWDDWLRKVPDEARAQRVAEGEPGAKLATLEYRVLHRLDGATLVELRPLTGRMHQLRVQSAVRGHAVQGDALYAPGSPPFGPVAEISRDAVIALHARGLAFDHPFTREPLTISAPVPDYWPPLPATF